jgi:filamentous hemagglutinin family protein
MIAKYLQFLVLAGATGLAGGQHLCPGLDGNPELMTPGTATCALDPGGNATISMSDASLIRWEQFNIDEGQTFNFNFLGGAANKTVVNFTTGSRRNSIEGNLISNGRVILVTPGQRLSISGMIQAESFLASTIEADDLNELLNNQSTSFGAGPSGGRLLRVEPGASLEATGGDLVLAGEVVSISGGAAVLAPVGSVRTVAAEEFTLANAGAERVNITTHAPFANVLTNGRVEAANVEMKASAEITNGGLIQTGGGVGKVYLRVGPGGSVINAGTGLINGILEVTPSLTNDGGFIDPTTGDAATTVKSSVSRFPALRRPGEKPGKETLVVDTGGVAASVDNSQARSARRSQNVAANRSALHRKSSFFGLRGGATRKKRE